MNPDLANLLGALRDQPDDSVAYLALADWCLEQPDDATQSRGEHVRLSLTLGDLSRRENTARDHAERLTVRESARPIREQVKSLERRYRSEWLGSMRAFAHRCNFLAGGLVKLEVTGGRADLARKSKVAAPTEREFAWVSSLIARSISLEELRWVAGLLPTGCVRMFGVGVSGPWGSDDSGLVEVLGDCAWMTGLRMLESWNRLGVRGTEQLAMLPCLGQLESLRLHHAAPQAAGCSALGHSPHLGRLRELHLGDCVLGAEEMRSLLVESFAPPLTALALESNQITPSAAEILANWPGLAAVRRLTLNRNPLGDAGLIALTQSPYLRELRELSVQSCDLSSRGLTQLALAPMSRLERLDIYSNDRIADAGLMALCRSSSLPALRKVTHTRNDLRPATWAALQARFGE